MHFPPTDDEDDILAPTENDRQYDRSPEESAVGAESTIANWSEPALRSDRMCWSLIGTSYVLAFELGIFGTYSDGILSDGLVRRYNGSPEFMRRADRIERLLYIFIVQASGRFGLPSMWPNEINRFTFDNFRDRSLLGVFGECFRVSSTRLIRLAAKTVLSPESVDETQLLWVELMVIMKACNDQLFTTKDQTAALIQSGEYVQRLQWLQPLLRAWKTKFENLEGDRLHYTPSMGLS